MAKKILLEKGIMIKEVPVGFSWTTLFWGQLVPLYRGDLAWCWILFGVFSTPVAILKLTNLTRIYILGVDPINRKLYLIIFLSILFFLRFIVALIYNRRYVKKLLSNDWEPTSEYDREVLKTNGFIKE